MTDFSEYCETVAQNFTALSHYGDAVGCASNLIKSSLRKGNKVIFCGNGGSAADSQHLAAEFMGRFLLERNPLPALALTVDSSAVTAIGNDYGFEHIFSRQLSGIGKLGDILFALSTSGNSSNIIMALSVAREIGISSIGLTGADGGEMKQLCDICICAPSNQTNHIQEMHIAIGHAICGEVERDLCE